MRWNILLLMLVSFLPFPTMLMARAINKTDDAERVAVIFYGLILLTIPITMATIWNQAVRRRLLKPEATDAEARAVARLTLFVVALALFRPQSPHETPTGQT